MVILYVNNCIMFNFCFFNSAQGGGEGEVYRRKKKKVF